MSDREGLELCVSSKALQKIKNKRGRGRLDGGKCSDRIVLQITPDKLCSPRNVFRKTTRVVKKTKKKLLTANIQYIRLGKFFFFSVLGCYI